MFTITTDPRKDKMTITFVDPDLFHKFASLAKDDQPTEYALYYTVDTDKLSITFNNCFDPTDYGCWLSTLGGILQSM